MPFSENLVSVSEKRYDLEDRTAAFARRVRSIIKRIPPTAGNTEDGKQLLRSSGSIGANYIEANESLGRKDFLMHVKICRKEAKETGYWLSLLDLPENEGIKAEQALLVKESVELTRIFGAIVRKCEN